MVKKSTPGPGVIWVSSSPPHASQLSEKNDDLAVQYEECPWISQEWTGFNIKTTSFVYRPNFQRGFCLCRFHRFLSGPTKKNFWRFYWNFFHNWTPLCSLYSRYGFNWSLSGPAKIKWWKFYWDFFPNWAISYGKILGRTW